MCLLRGHYMVLPLWRLQPHRLEIIAWCRSCWWYLLGRIVCETTQYTRQNRRTPQSVEDGRGRGCCARTGKSKGQQVEERTGKAPYGKGIS